MSRNVGAESSASSEILLERVMENSDSQGKTQEQKAGRIAIFQTIWKLIHVLYESYMAYTVILGVGTFSGASAVIFVVGNSNIILPKEALELLIVVLVLLLVVMTMIFFFWRRRVIQSHQAFVRILEVKVSSSELEVVRLRELSEALQESVEFYGFAEESFARVAADNAFCDRKIFEALFTYDVESEIFHAPRTDVAIGEMRQNIRSSLDLLCQLAYLATDENCAASFKVFGDTSRPNPREWSVHTYERDTSSRARANSYSVMGDTIGQNTALISIVCDGEKFFSSDDLADLEKKRLYKNFHKNYGAFYNATLVLPVYSVDDRFIPIGSLALDNRNGGLESHTLRNYAREIAWRISVLYHRIQKIQKLSIEK